MHRVEWSGMGRRFGEEEAVTWPVQRLSVEPCVWVVSGGLQCTFWLWHGCTKESLPQGQQAVPLRTSRTSPLH